MAIYHFSAKVISRSTGSSAVASAAYRSASRLHDDRIGRHHDFSNKAGVVHSEVLLPEGAPEHLRDRAQLWNAVEADEKRIDAQLAREIEFAIPSELDRAEGIRLAREFVAEEFVARGMIADLNVHWDIGVDGLPKPHAHVMVTMRAVSADGFGPKIREWNRTDMLEHWREAWAEHANRRLVELDIDARIDHRSLEAQGIALEPQNKIGPAAARMAAGGRAGERVAEHQAIARGNGERIIADPRVALDAITRTQATFTRRDLARFVHRHSDGQEQFERAMRAVRGCPDLVGLGRDGRGEARFTSREMIAAEQRLAEGTERLVGRAGHGVPERSVARAVAFTGKGGFDLSGDQRAALDHVLDKRDLAVVVGYAGTGKSAMLGVAREAWVRSGYVPIGVALSGIAAENLEAGSGMASRTLASLEHQWQQGRDLLGPQNVLVIDEAGMIGSRQMERVIAEADRRRAKVVLVGDPEQLQAIEAGAAFRSIAERHGSVEITGIRRQRDDWQRDATRQLATGRTGEAVRAYDDRGHVHAAETREQARGELIDAWDRDRQAAPSASRIILTHTNDEVLALNQGARERLQTAGELGEDVMLNVERGARPFAAGDRVMFLRNERGLGVKNGSLGRVEEVSPAHMAVRLDDGRSVAFDLKDYAAVDHGYAATIHKAQGMTVDRAHVLATPGLDRHAAYVALSRHRERVDLHYGQDDFSDGAKLVRTLSRERVKDMASDYPVEPGAEVQGTFAARREATEPVQTTNLPLVEHVALPPRAPGMFDGLQLRSGPVAAIEPAGNPLPRAVERFARAAAEVLRTRAKGVEALPHQQAALEKAGQALDAIRPGAARDLESALARDRRLVEQASSGRTTTAIRAMLLEAEIRTDPALRADRFVDDWRRIGRHRRALLKDGDYTGAQRATGTMRELAKRLDFDLGVESLLQKRARELGIERSPGASVSQRLQDWLSRSRDRGLSR